MRHNKAEINAKGLANGWHAQRLAAMAKQTGRTMADLHREQIAGASAFSVPAECTKVTATKVFYRFSDGSETYILTN
jgi:hypothetical protein